jgi:hypothetical protein
LRGHFHFARRVLGEEVLIDCLGEDVPNVCTHLQHSILGPGYSQLVEMELQLELVEVDQRNLAERVDEV